MLRRREPITREISTLSLSPEHGGSPLSRTRSFYKDRIQSNN